MSLILLGLGSESGAVHYFYVPLPGHDTPSFESIQTDSTFNWVAQNRLSREPAQQFTGSGEEVKTIEGRLFPNHFGGLSTLENLRAEAKAGNRLTMVQYFPLEDPHAMAGRPLGTWGIRRIRDSAALIGANGLPHRVDFTIEMVRYGDDVVDRYDGQIIDGSYADNVPGHPLTSYRRTGPNYESGREVE